MNAPHSNRWLRNLLQGGLLLFLLLVASYVTIGRILIANVDNYRSDLRNLLQQQLGVAVHIGQLQGDWAYLNPSLQIDNLMVGDKEEIQLDQFEFSVDVVASLRETTPIIREIKAAGVRLGLEKQADRWVLAGLPPAQEPLNLEPILRSLDYLLAAEVADFQLQVFGEAKSFVLKSAPGQVAEVRRAGEVLSLSLPMQIEEAGRAEALLLAGQLSGGIDDKNRSGNLYLKLPDVNITEFLTGVLPNDLELSRLSAAGEVWLNFADEDFTLQGMTQVRANFSSLEYELVTQQQFAASGHMAGEIVATVAEFNGQFADVSFQFSDVGLSLEPGPGGMQLALQIPELNLPELLSTPLKLGERGIGLSPEQVEMVTALNPGGTLSSLLAVVKFGETLDYSVVGKLEGISVERYQALPVISDLNGLVRLGPRGGFLDMINERPFSLQFPGLFDHEWYFDSAKTRMTYEVTEAGILVQTGLVEAHWGDLIANGRVQLKVPGPRLKTTWGLSLGVQNADLLDAFRYLPKTLKEDVRMWLERSILAGRSVEAGMLFHGSLAKEADKDQKAHQLYFEVEDTILDYDSNWPRFDELVATIFIDNFEISSHDARGIMFDSEVYDSTVMVPVSADGVADTILIDGNVRGEFADGVRLLVETPLREATSYMAEGWVGKGAMNGTARLNIPIGGRAERGEPTWAEVAVALNDVDLAMTRFDLDFSALNGEFLYESNNAVKVEAFTARLFDQEVQGSVRSSGDVTGGEIIVTSAGHIDAQDLYQWSAQPLLSRADGLISYETDLHIFYGDRGDEPIYVRAVSELEGVAINMPEPLTKNSEELRSLMYKQTFETAGDKIELRLGEQVHASLQVSEGSLAGGQLHFGVEPLRDVSFEKFKVTGQLDHVVYEQWDALSTDLQALSEGSMEEELEKTLDHVTLNIAFFDVFGFEMDKVLTRITREPDFWHVDLTNEWLEGRVSVNDDPAAPLSIEMQRIELESDDGDAAEDPLVEVAPGDLALARFAVDALTLDGEDYGTWGFLYEPQENGALLKDLQVKVKGLNVAEDASVSWQVIEGKHKSKFAGTVLVPDLGSALQQWGYASSIEGQDFSLSADVSWPGSPAMVDLEVINGLIRLEEGEGRFVQADSNMGALRLLGIFDFASLARRFRLDFSDVVDSGFSFNKIEGETRFASGIVDVVEPIMIEGSGSIFKVGGRVNLHSQELDNDMIVTLPVNRNLPWYAAYSALATGPLTGAGVFLVQQVFQNQINAISSAKYKISGTMDEPVIEFVSIFSDSVREAPAEEPTGQ